MYSGTNTAEAGVDEPDLVKTDGRRIVTVIGGVLRVVDVATQRLTGVLDLSAAADLNGAVAANLLLAGDHALVLFGQAEPIVDGSVPISPPAMSEPLQTGMGEAGAGLAGQSAASTSGSAEPGTAASVPAPIIGPRLVLVDLSAETPRIVSEYTMDGALVDARQIGSVARVVVHSAPRVYFPPSAANGAQQRTADNQAMIARAAVGAWLPRYAVTSGQVRRTGQVNCADVSRPATAAYSGTSMLTVLTFDLSSGILGTGQPVTIVADGDTVYSNGTSLYIASDHQWTVPPGAAPPGAAQGRAPASAVTATAAPTLPQQYTALYKFDISGQRPPVYQAAGTVPGWLLGSSAMTQYALSEWNGALRVATTTNSTITGGSWQPAQSAVYVLTQVGSALVTIGKIGGLGQGEQIFAVRFAGPVGYVVTFRQTDPLYTIDLSDPAQPRLAGELLLRGYSAYLDPIDATHVIGVGQDADTQGETQGTQISLFDVADLANPVRLAVYHLQFSTSEAEFDPHAFLYWPATRLLVIPVQIPTAVTPPADQGSGLAPQPGMPIAPVSEAVVLHVGGHSITEMGTITHPAMPGLPTGDQIRRALVTGPALWTLSGTGLKANELTSLAPIGWVPFE